MSRLPQNKLRPANTAASREIVILGHLKTWRHSSMAPIALLASALLAFSPNTPLCPRPVAPKRVPAITAADPAAAESLKEQLPVILGALALGGGGVYAYQQKKDDGPSAAAVARPKKAAAPATKPPAARSSKAASTPSGSSWGLNGRRTVSPHRMSGTMPKPKPRQAWKPPKGWTPPKKPVQSWYDRGDRLTPPSPPPAPPEAPPPPAKKKTWADTFFWASQTASPSSPAPGGSSWGLTSSRRGISPHRMAGTMPKPPPRKLWKPPPGWKPPSKPAPPPGVASWYDRGVRL